MIYRLFCKIFSPIYLKMNRIKNPIDWGNLRKLKPISEVFGGDRGKPIDRYYIEQFLKENSQDIKGSVLEILNNNYTKLFGNKKVTSSDILDINLNNKNATVYADLRDTKGLPKEKYNCIILTQTLHEIDDYMAVLKSVYKMLKPGGILLCSVPTISRIDYSAGLQNDFWRFTKAGAQYIFKQFFKEKNLLIKSYGNILVGISFLEGISLSELKKEEIEYIDDNFPLIICIKAKK